MAGSRGEQPNEEAVRPQSPFEGVEGKPLNNKVPVNTGFADSGGVYNASAGNGTSEKEEAPKNRDHHLHDDHASKNEETEESLAKDTPSLNSEHLSCTGGLGSPVGDKYESETEEKSVDGGLPLNPETIQLYGPVDPSALTSLLGVEAANKDTRTVYQSLEQADHEVGNVLEGKGPAKQNDCAPVDDHNPVENHAERPQTPTCSKEKGLLREDSSALTVTGIPTITVEAPTPTVVRYPTKGANGGPDLSSEPSNPEESLQYWQDKLASFGADNSLTSTPVAKPKSLDSLTKEALLYICEELVEDESNTDIYNLCLIKPFHKLAMAILYRHPKYSDLMALMRTIIARPGLAGFVNVIDIDATKMKVKQNDLEVFLKHIREQDYNTLGMLDKEKRALQLALNLDDDRKSAAEEALIEKMKRASEKAKQWKADIRKDQNISELTAFFVNHMPALKHLRLTTGYQGILNTCFTRTCLPDCHAALTGYNRRPISPLHGLQVLELRFVLENMFVAPDLRVVFKLWPLKHFSLSLLGSYEAFWKADMYDSIADLTLPESSNIRSLQMMNARLRPDHIHAMLGHIKQLEVFSYHICGLGSLREDWFNVAQPKSGIRLDALKIGLTAHANSLTHVSIMNTEIDPDLDTWVPLGILKGFRNLTVLHVDFQLLQPNRDVWVPLEAFLPDSVEDLKIAGIGEVHHELLVNGNGQLVLVLRGALPLLSSFGLGYFEEWEGIPGLEEESGGWEDLENPEELVDEVPQFVRYDPFLPEVREAFLVVRGIHLYTWRSPLEATFFDISE